MPEIDAVIMAAGRSKRMGQCKLSMAFAKSTVLETFLKSFPYNNYSQVMLIAGKNLKIPEIKDLETIINSQPELGQSYSIGLGLKHTNSNNPIMFFVADQPMLKAETIDKLVISHLQYPEQIIVPIIMDSGERKNPVIFPAKFKRELAALVGDVGGRKVIKNNSSSVREISFENALEFKDIDDYADYTELLATLE
ncbi:MAG: NTP transferase domain-containing protein [Desulfotalea sp.]